MGNGKRFMAYGIAERLKKAGHSELLKVLEAGVTPSDRRKRKLHEVFEPSFDLKLCRSYKFVQQKLDYMHSNPVSKKWNLVADQSDYTHSSARFYEYGIPGIYQITHSNDWTGKYWQVIPTNEKTPN